MDNIRKEILEIDAKMIELTAKRMKLSKKLGDLKKRSGAPVRDKKREASLLKQWQEIALIHDVSPELIKKLWTLILSESIEIQKSI